MLKTGAFGADYLQERIDREIMLARPMGIIVEAANDVRLILRCRRDASLGVKKCLEN